MLCFPYLLHSTPSSPRFSCLIFIYLSFLYYVSLHLIPFAYSHFSSFHFSMNGHPFLSLQYSKIAIQSTLKRYFSTCSLAAQSDVYSFSISLLYISFKRVFADKTS